MSPGSEVHRDDTAASCADGEALQRFARLAARFLSAPASEILLRLSEAEWKVVAGSVAGEGSSDALPPWCHSVCRTGETVAIADARGYAPAAVDAEALPEGGILALLCVPLVTSEGELVGAIGVGDVSPREWSEAHIETLNELARVIVADCELRRELAGHRRSEQELVQGALHDPLTGLPNRLLFMERLGHAILRARRRDNPQFAVLFLDLDRFKVVNDSLGHHVGDELLVTIAKRLEACLRTEDTVARLGGDEFAILLESIIDVTDATRVAERIRQELTAPVNLSGYEVFTSASIGIALSSISYDRPEYLLRNADMAMYRAKASGLAHYEVFDRKMHAEALSRLQMETDLRQAVERSEFHLHYQPIVALESGTIMGFEALLRWNHPAQGPVSPLDFISLAEETGLILPIGRWVLEEACRQVQAWQSRSPRGQPLSVGVNLSVKQFSQPDLVDQVRSVLRETGLDPHALKLEITESVIVDNADFATHMLEELKSLGVHVFMDDFGTGYSSLSYMHRLPLDSIKIDRSFISGMESEGRNYQLVRTIIMLARSVGMSVVAEGVETEGQLRELRRLGCEYGQGFFFSRPVAPAEAEALLARDPRW